MTELEELLKSSIKKHIAQLDCIMGKVKHISRYSEFPEIRLFYYKLDEKKKYFERAISSPGAWQQFAGIARNKRLTDSILVGWRIEIFAHEVRYERLLLYYGNELWGFYNPDRFLLFGLPEDYVYNGGMLNGSQRPEYSKVRTEIQNNPDLILKEREKVTQYLKKGYENSVAKRNGKPFPIDVTIPYGY